MGERFFRTVYRGKCAAIPPGSGSCPSTCHASTLAPQLRKINILGCPVDIRASTERPSRRRCKKSDWRRNGLPVSLAGVFVERCGPEVRCRRLGHVIHVTRRLARCVRVVVISAPAVLVRFLILESTTVAVMVRHFFLVSQNLTVQLIGQVIDGGIHVIVLGIRM